MRLLAIGAFASVIGVGVVAYAQTAAVPAADEPYWA